MTWIGSVLMSLYRRWRYVEDVEPSPDTPPDRSEAARLRSALEREEWKLAEYRRMKLAAMARESESSLRALKGRLLALEMGARR